MEIIKKAIIITPADLKLLLKFNVSLIPIIKDAKIQNWVRNTMGTTKLGTNTKNLNKPGAWAKPTVIIIFLKFVLVLGSGNNFTPIT